METRTATHQVVDFGPGPNDETLGYPVEGTEAECAKYAEELNANYPNVRTDGKDRFCIQGIPSDDEPAPGPRIEAETTARPWRVYVNDDEGVHILSGIDAGSETHIVCEHIDTEANAALIVQAVNSHQALVSAVKNLLADVAIYRQELYGNRIKGPVQIHAEAALALAEGKE